MGHRSSAVFQSFIDLESYAVGGEAAANVGFGFREGGECAPELGGLFCADLLFLLSFGC